MKRARSEKLPGYESLYETTIGDRRIFSTIAGRQVLMAVVVVKKKHRLGAKQLRQIDAQVKRFAENREEIDRGG